MKLKHCWMPGALGLALFGAAAIGCDDSNTNPMPDDSVISSPKGGKSGSSQSSKAGKGGGGSGGKSSDSSGGKGGETSQTQGNAGGQSGSSSSNSGSGGSAAGQGGSAGSNTGMMQSAQMSSADCKDKKDCFCGTPKEQADFLNQCTDAVCAHFDNSKLKWTGEGAPPPPKL